MARRFIFAATTAGKSFCLRPPVLSRRTSLDAAVDKNAANEGVISAAASRAAVRVIRTDEELMIARLVCRALGLGMSSEKGNSDHATKSISRLDLLSASGVSPIAKPRPPAQEE